MYENKASKDPEKQTGERAYWSEEITKAKRRFQTFWDAGDTVIDAYRMQKSDGNEVVSKDRYNVLYSSTETIRPNLYAQRPTVRIKMRNRDANNPQSKMMARLLEGSIEYVIEEEDIDEVMESVVEDYLLPGIGVAWVRYEPNIEDTKDKEGDVSSKLLDEMVKIDYIYWQDWVCGTARNWKTVPWVAKRTYMNKEQAIKRFGAETARGLSYLTRETTKRDADVGSDTAEIWEIWCKTSKSAYWYCESYPSDLLDKKEDPLRLKNFFPCPRPLRAIANTRSFVPRALYSQYKTQADTLNVLTKRIRLLGEALRVVGVFDGSQQKLSDLLNPASGNRMIPIDSWAAFAQAGGIKGNVEWLPLDQIVQTLVQLQQAREVCKNEIYEVTGFSDIVRGVSKASETLGAQNLKANWAGARVRKMQKEVQRFARDVIAIVGEVISEHCEPATVAMFSGVDMPTAELVQANPQALAQMQNMQTALQMIRVEAKRVATIDIETDSTIMADEEAQRKDRMDFLGAAGAFLQQAVPAMTATPELGPLLAAMLMFTVRTFPASRPIEEEFEKVQQVLETRGQQPQQGNKEGEAQAQSAQAVAQIRAQTEQAKISTQAQMDQQKEQNRHEEALAELQLRDREVTVKEQELQLKARELEIKMSDADVNVQAMQLEKSKAEHSAQMDIFEYQQENDRMNLEDERAREEAAATAFAAENESIEDDEQS